jgi:hypothetical protein
MKHFQTYLLAALSSCTFACPITQKTAPSPCADHTECFPGFECRSGSCLGCDDVCEDNRGEGIGPRGAIICGADDVCLHFPPNALATPQTILIEKLMQIPLLPNATALTPVYSTRPEGLMLDSDIRIEIPITSSVGVSRISVYQADSMDGPWQELVGTSTTVTAIGNTNHLSLFVATRSNKE